METDILVIGAGASGVCAAIQAARMGKKVILTNEHDWPGGMLTAAGVSCIDGNYDLPSGLFGEFIAYIHDYYGGKENVKTGWVSFNCFEPYIAKNILSEMIEKEINITTLYNCVFQEALVNDNTILGADFIYQNSKLHITTQITIDATELGDVIFSSGCSFRVGREANNETGESSAPGKSDLLIQDLTYAAILKDYKKGIHTIKKPSGYDKQEFKNCCKEYSDSNKKNLPDAQTMLNYGRLPNDKYMINWPNNGNDFYAPYLDLNSDQNTHWKNAKEKTLRFIYFIQNELGFSHLGLADDEFPSHDKLPLIPYIRESRRINGIENLTLDDIKKPYSNSKYQKSIAVGNYPLDHHHKASTQNSQEVFPPIPAFAVPFGCLIPEEIKGLIAAEKNISVTHTVNGCTRLQPVVMLIGQAAGAAAALSLEMKKSPGELSVRTLQNQLLKDNCWLMPYTDMSPENKYFVSAQRIGLCDLLKADYKPKDWANQCYFRPHDNLTEDEFSFALEKLIKFNFLKKIPDKESRLPLNSSDLVKLFSKYSAKGKIGSKTQFSFKYKKSHILTRAEFAYISDAFFNSFETILE